MPNAKSKGARQNWDRIVGLTGGMGSGKSTVLAFFRKNGAFVLDADAIVRNLLDKNRSVRSEIRKKFGTLNRRALAETIFSSKRKKKQLERLLHPLVRNKIWSELNRKSGRIAVLDIPLLYESKWERKLDDVVVVDASMPTRLRRLEEKGFALVDAKRRIKNQMDLREKIRRADYVVDNNSTLLRTKKQVDEIWAKLTTRKHGGA